MVNLRTKAAHEQTTSLELHPEQLTPLPANETPMSQVLVESLDSTMSIDTHSPHIPIMIF